MGDGLETLRVSELLERARALGAHADHLDELLDDEEPKLALTRLIRGWRTRAHSPDEVDLSADVAQLVAALSEAEDPDARMRMPPIEENLMEGDPDAELFAPASRAPKGKKRPSKLEGSNPKKRAGSKSPAPSDPDAGLGRSN